MKNPLRDDALKQLGLRLREFRTMREDTQAVFSERLGVSERTLRRMEQGDPGVNIGVWVEALDVIGRLEDLDRVLLRQRSLFEGEFR